MDDTYSPVNVGEALYAELDRESIHSGNPSYQNTAYSQCGEVSYVSIHHITFALISFRLLNAISFLPFHLQPTGG